MGALRRNKYLMLLAVLFAVFLTQPFLGRESVGTRIAYDLLTAAMLLGVLLVVFPLSWERGVGFLLALPVLALLVARYAVPYGGQPPATLTFSISLGLFMGFAVAIIVREILRRRARGSDDVLGAFAGYLLLGVGWGSLYAGLHAVAPDAFSVSPDIRWQLGDWHLSRALFTFLSFATMASLGYNDIAPTAPLSNTLTWLQVIFAQFYLAVVVAQIVGLKLARTIAPDRAEGP